MFSFFDLMIAIENLILTKLQAFYREELFKTVLGFKDLEDFIQNFWEKWALSKGRKNYLLHLPFPSPSLNPNLPPSSHPQ